MILSRLRAVRPLARPSRLTGARSLSVHSRLLSKQEDDPNMNGNYPEPPAIPRQFRDPHGDWWDKQERRNFGEPLHEDNDILAIFSPHRYTHAPPGKAIAQLLMFAATVYGLYKAVQLVYPDMPAVPKEYEGGLDRELGGKGALLAPEASRGD